MYSNVPLSRMNRVERAGCNVRLNMLYRDVPLSRMIRGEREGCDVPLSRMITVYSPGCPGVVNSPLSMLNTALPLTILRGLRVTDVGPYPRPYRMGWTDSGVCSIELHGIPMHTPVCRRYTLGRRRYSIGCRRYTTVYHRHATVYRTWIRTSPTSAPPD